MAATPLAVFGSSALPAPAHNDAAAASSLPSLIDAYERSLILAALAATRGHQRRAARVLGIGATTLHAKLKRLRLDKLAHPESLPARTEAATEEFRWRGRLTAPRAVEVRVVNGDIDIGAAADPDAVEIVALKHPRPLAASLLGVEILVTQGATALVVEARYTDAAGMTQPAGVAAEPLRVDLRLCLPTDASVDARTLNGDIEVAGITGVLLLETGRGTVRAFPSASR